MSVQVISRDERCLVTVAVEMTIGRAADLKNELLAALSGCTDVEINLAAVDEIDSAGIQLLVLAKREAVAAGKRLRLTAHSKAVVEILDLCNLGGYFGDPVVIPSGLDGSGDRK